MCKCKQVDRLPNPRKGYYDYVFECIKDNGKKKFITLTSTNDSQAKQMAELKCEKS